jgi:ERF superfamily protein
MSEQTATAVFAKPNVYECIAAVSAEIAQTGISKNRENQTQKYKFRGIDDVYNALAPILAKHKLVILPRMLSRLQTERQTHSGGVLFSVVVDAEFDFVSAADGSKHTTKAFGEAMDSADKATNKAMSAAYKYTAFQTFCIPTEGDNDADAQTPAPTVAKAPPGYEAWLKTLQATATMGSPALKTAWTASSPALRSHLTSTANATWEALKEQAAKVAATEAA